MSRRVRVAYAVAGACASAYGRLARPCAPLLARRFDPPLRLQLGSGLAYLEGWVNIDWAPLPFVLLRRGGRKPDLYVDLASGIPFGDGCASHVFSSNFLEHLARDAARRCLRESYRVLQPGGRIRVVVPDVEAYARAYVARDLDFFTRVGGDVYWPTDVTTPMEHLAVIVQGSKALGWSHFWAYDYETLSLYLREAGFSDVERFETNESSDALLSGLEGDRFANLAVEALRA